MQARYTSSNMSRVTPVILFFVMVCQVSVLAQSKGRVINDGSSIWRVDNVAVAAGTVKGGMILEIIAQLDRWYEVVIPVGLSGSGGRGLIAQTQMRLIAGSPDPPLRAGAPKPPVPTPTQEQAASPPPPARQQPSSRTGTRAFSGFLAAGGGYQLTSNNVHDAKTFIENAEQARLSTDYTVQKGPAFDVNGGGIVASHLALGAGVTRFSRSTPSTLSGSSPHPFFFSQPRAFSGSVDSLMREELAVHVLVGGVFPAGDRVQVMVSGGPSFFQVKQDVVTGYTLNEAYPYDQATFKNAVTTSAKDSKIGFNAGGDVAVFFSRQVGVGLSAKFAQAKVDLPSASGSTTEVKVGGFQTGGGLRVRF